MESPVLVPSIPSAPAGGGLVDEAGAGQPGLVRRLRRRHRPYGGGGNGGEKRKNTPQIEHGVTRKENRLVGSNLRPPPLKLRRRWSARRVHTSGRWRVRRLTIPLSCIAARPNGVAGDAP